MESKFIRVTKDNATKDRGFISVDAICSVFENRENHNVSIMTMDGFWYDVVDDVEKLWLLVTGKPLEKEAATDKGSKREYFRRKRMLPAPCSEKVQSSEGSKPLIKDSEEIGVKPGISKYAKKKEEAI